MNAPAGEGERATIRLDDGSELELRFFPHGTRARPNLPRLLATLKLLIQSEARSPEPDEHVLCPGIVGQSEEMRSLCRKIRKVATTHATVLITGENGTGKELVARAIHALSSRAGGPFVAANCSAFNDNLLESELFGHRRGAFTGAVAHKPGLFEEADGGTFLLDEVGDMSPALQAKLLRVLQEGTFLPVGGTQMKRVDVRIIAATNRDLAKMVQDKSFREDLYYRLHVVSLRPPPLRERREDIPLLVAHFGRQLAQRHGSEKRVHPETMARLEAHHWPGNVRELQNELERMWVLSGEGALIGPEHLSASLKQRALHPGQEEGAGADAEAPPEPLAALLTRVEREVLVEALARTGGNRTRAAEQLGISRRNLIRKLEQHGLQTGAAETGSK